ncbi:hypothetical protein LV75_001643 [Actinokineospora diospyrosa]|uniref:Immunity protein 50 of polymorphic toxin system n=1 Tax=Actinokineospora diospyrosa TaxID=103728 RepID=A0ABT1I953_9PSEU|nr:hypothetical protein [Actinokineospora diospyrosa]
MPIQYLLSSANTRGFGVIKLLGTAFCDAATAVYDHSILMDVSWEPGFAGMPLYLCVSGSEGGELELKVDPRTGALLRFIVIISPPETVELAVPRAATSLSQTVTVDRSLWEPVRNDYDPSVAYLEEPLSLNRSGDWVEVAFSNNPTAHHVWADQVRVGITPDHTLATIGATCAPAPEVVFLT